MEQCPECGKWTLVFSIYYQRTQCESCGYIEPEDKLQNIIKSGTRNEKLLALEIKNLKKELKSVLSKLTLKKAKGRVKMENNFFEKDKIDNWFFEKIEKEFGICHEEKPNGKSDNNIIFLEGAGNILLSAPHSTNQGYLGDKKRDFYTGAIAILLHQKTNLPVILFKGKSDSRDFENYKKMIKEICLVKDIPFLKKIKFFIDIHGCWNYFAVDIGTMYGKSLLGRFDLDFHLVKFLNKQGFGRSYNCDLLISHNAFSAGDPTKEVDDNSLILTEWVSKALNIPSIQLEISRKLRGENPVLTKNFLKELVNYLNFAKTIV